MLIKRLSQEGKFVHVSFRITRELRVALEKEAKQRNVNLNSLATSIFMRHFSINRLGERAQAVPLNRLLFVGMLNKIEGEEMEQLGREIGPKIIKQAFAFLGLDFDLEGLIHNYFQPMSLYSRWFSFNLTGSGSSRKLMFEHSYGRKWSSFLKQYIGAMLKSATGVEPRIVAEDELVTVFFSVTEFRGIMA